MQAASAAISVADARRDAPAMSAQPLNTAYARGGLGCVVATVENLTQVKIPYAALFSFEGTVKMADAVLVCATAADAKNYAAIHKNAIRSAIEGERDGKACLIAKIAYMPGKQTERIEDKDTTYVLTEILIVAVKTPYGLLRMRPNLAYTLMPVDEEKA